MYCMASLLLPRLIPSPVLYIDSIFTAPSCTMYWHLGELCSRHLDCSGSFSLGKLYMIYLIFKTRTNFLGTTSRSVNIRLADRLQRVTINYRNWCSEYLQRPFHLDFLIFSHSRHSSLQALSCRISLPTLTSSFCNLSHQNPSIPPHLSL